MFENLRQYVTTEKIGDCWRCGEELNNSHIQGTKAYPEIVCSRCGLIIEITSKTNRWIGYTFMIGITTFAFGYLIALLLF